MSLHNIVIFGASGQIGLKATNIALQRGYTVRVLLRENSEFPEALRAQVEVIKGDVTNKDDVNKALEKQDAVIVTLGTRNDLGHTRVLSEGMKNIIEGMKINGIRIVSVCISAFLLYEPEKVPPIFKALNADHQRMFDCLKASDLDWIAVLPPHFTDDVCDKYIIKHDASPGRSVSKIALGTFMVDSLLRNEHYQKVCGIALDTSTRINT